LIPIAPFTSPAAVTLTGLAACPGVSGPFTPAQTMLLLSWAHAPRMLVNCPLLVLDFAPKIQFSCRPADSPIISVLLSPSVTDSTCVRLLAVSTEFQPMSLVALPGGFSPSAVHTA